VLPGKTSTATGHPSDEHKSPKLICRVPFFPSRLYSPVADEDVTQFWSAYWEVSSRNFPALKMPHPGIKPSNADWPDFRADELGKDFNIVHKMAQGVVDFQIRGALKR